MKNGILFKLIIIAAFSFNCSAQEANTALQTGIKPQINSDSGIVKPVSDSTLIKKNDLGPNKVGLASQQFAKEDQHINSEKASIKGSLDPTASLKSQSGYASVVMINTYERVAEKGYKSVEIFQKLANAFYFNEELDKAAKWYGELFEMATDLEPEYYYRYSHSLKAIGENEKSNEMLEKFNQLSGN